MRLVEVASGLWRAPNGAVLADYRTFRQGWNVRWTVATFGGAFEERRERDFKTKKEALAFLRWLNGGG